MLREVLGQDGVVFACRVGIQVATRRIVEEPDRKHGCEDALDHVVETRLRNLIA